MKIAILTSRYPKADQPYNHMFVHVRSLYFKSKNEEVTVFVPSKEKSAYTIDGVQVVCDSGKNIANQLDQYDISYLHLLNIYPMRADGGYSIYKKLLQMDKPIVMYIHGTEVFRYPTYMHDFAWTPSGISKVFYRNFWHFNVMRKLVHKFNQKKKIYFMFPSQWMKEVSEQNFNIKFKTTFIIPNGIETNMFKYNSNFSKRNTILVLRPFEDNKYNVDTAIRIMKYLPDHFTMDIYGKGRLQSKLEKIIVDENLSERVVINNSYIPREKLPSFFSNYGTFVATTRCDAQGVTMCEALSSGLLVCSNPVTAIPEFITDNINGILGSSPQEIATKILSATASKEAFEKITVEGRKSMKKIDLEKVGKQELDVFKKLIEV
jgi:glycosyltransferase involved in cell wall biosynthesis